MSCPLQDKSISKSSIVHIMCIYMYFSAIQTEHALIEIYDLINIYIISTYWFSLPIDASGVHVKFCFD